MGSAASFEERLRGFYDGCDDEERDVIACNIASKYSKTLDGIAQNLK